MEPWPLGCSKKLKVSLIFLPMQGAMCGYYTEPIKKKYWIYLQYWWYARAFCKYKGSPKISKGKFIPIFILKNIGQLGCCGWSFQEMNSWSPDELKDTHIGQIACTENVHTQLHVHAIRQKIACTCNLQGMQSYQDGCLSTRLDFSNACACKLTLTADFLNNIL